MFRAKAFTRFARKEDIEDRILWDAVRRALKKPDADLGGGVIKQRVARPHEGKSGGYRTIIVFRKGERAVFVYGFAKNDQGNLSPDQLKAFKKLAPVFLDASDSMLDKMLQKGELTEVSDGEESSGIP